MHDAADMIGVAEYLLRRHRRRVDAINDRVTVRPVLRDGHEDITAVVVDATGVIDRAFTDQKIADELARRVELEEVPLACAGVAVVAVLRLRITLCRRPD